MMSNKPYEINKLEGFLQPENYLSCFLGSFSWPFLLPFEPAPQPQFPLAFAIGDHLLSTDYNQMNFHFINICCFNAYNSFNEDSDSGKDLKLPFILII